MNVRYVIEVTCGTIKDWFVDFFRLQKWPDDPVQRRRMQAFILGGGAGSAMKPGANGKCRIEMEGEDGKGNSKV